MIVCYTAPAPAFVWLVYRSPALGGGEEFAGSACYSDTEKKVTPAMVLDELKRVGIATAPITVQPPGGRTLVNLETIVSTQAPRFTRTVEILDQKVTLDIYPVSFTWDFGDGTTLTRDNPGIPWTASTQELTDAFTYHVYTHVASYSIGLTVAWTAKYQVEKEPWEDVDGTVAIASTPITIEAVEAVPRLVQ